MDWTYKDEPYTELTKGVYGFIYEITLDDETKYIGKKTCFETVTLPALKSGEIRPNAQRIGKNKNGKRVYFDIVTKESDWKTYNSSSKEVGNKAITKKEILELAPTKRSLTYLEEKWLFKHEVLEKDEYLNKNIGGRYFKGNLL